MAWATWFLWRNRAAEDTETRSAMFRNGSPATSALSIASRSGLEQAKQVHGMGHSSLICGRADKSWNKCNSFGTSLEQNHQFMGRFSATSRRRGNRINNSYGAGDGNRTHVRTL